MSIKNKRLHHLATLAPPPSPIPTGKGSRSAADETFVKYLYKSFRIPDLTLPDPLSQSADSDSDPSPCIVDYQSLASCDHDTIDGLLNSLRNFGAFLISSHGVSCEELRSLLQQAEHIILGPGARNIDRKNPESRNGEEILRGHFRNRMIEWTKKLADAEECRRFSQYVENIGCKLDRIAKEVVWILWQGLDVNEFPTEGWEATLSICRYAGTNPPELDKDVQRDQRDIRNDHDYTVRILLLVEEYSEIILRSETETGPVRFQTDADTVIVACGKELQERYHEGEGNFIRPLEPDFHEGTHLAIEYRFTLSTLHRALRGSKLRKLSVVDQVRISLIIILALKLLVKVLSWLV